MVGGVGLIVAAILGLFAYVSLTAPSLHPNPQDAPSVTGSDPQSTWSGAVEEGQKVARASLTEQNLPGLSVAVGIGGEIVWAEGFGWADLENKVKVTPDTSFRIGTASTVLTSAAVGLLLEKGSLKLDDEIQTYVPEFPKKQWPVTLRQLMGHLAGVRNDGGDEGPLLSQHCERTVEGLQGFAESSLLFEPGTRYRYSSYGWILVSAAVEAAANQRVLTFMRDQIFKPLGMDHTRPDSASDPISNRATPYFPRFGGDPRYGPDLMRPIDYSCYSGSSVFLSTPSDLVRFAMAVNGSIRQTSGAQGGRLLQPATVQLLQTSQRLPSGEETGYGLGWDLETATVNGEQTRVIGHDGDSLGGMVASLMTFPNGIAVAVTSNTSYADTFAVGLKVAEAFAKQGKSPANK
jgi:CubicO group peptidase (beta-lactamase class C family)